MGDGTGSTREKEEMKANRRWLDRVRDDIKDKGLLGEEVYHLHGGVCHRTSAPHKSENKMKRKIIGMCPKC